MTLTFPSLNTYITTNKQTSSAFKQSCFHETTAARPQPLDPTSNLYYIYSTLPSFTLVNDADLANHKSVVAAGPPYHFPGAGATVVTYMDFAANPDQIEGFWHRTQTVDYIIMLEGELELTLDGGERRVVKRGDVVIQRAPMHKWKNLSVTQPARYVAILQGAEGAKEDGVEYGSGV